MFQYDEEEDDIILCINCDAEFTVTKIDDDEQIVEFCPYCGTHLLEEEEYDEEADEDEDSYLN